MFKSARIKLTAWYLAIIMVISLSFSLVIYQGFNQEIQRALIFQKLRLENPQLPFPPRQTQRQIAIDEELLQDSRQRALFGLGFINLIILISSGTAGYFLAGKTLAPIKKMVDEQNRFVSDASHELRTPLTSLITSTEVNLRDKKLSLAQAKKLLAENLKDFLSLKKLSDNLLQLASPLTSNHQQFKEKINCEEIIKEAVRKIIPLVKEKEIDLKIINKEKGFIMGNADKLNQLLVIVLDNAIKYSPKNSVILLQTKILKHTLQIKVVDQGSGIDPLDLPFIFDRFYRSSKSRNKIQTDGYGLGLAIAKKIIEEHQGTIKVESTSVKGTVFGLYLPLV